MTGGTIDYSGIGIYNNSSKAIEITSGIIGIDDEVNIGTAIYNNKNANIDIKGNVKYYLLVDMEAQEQQFIIMDPERLQFLNKQRFHHQVHGMDTSHMESII